MQHSLRTLLGIVAAAAFVLALVIAWRAKPQAPAPPPAGRYQVFVTEDQIVVLDTATRSLWTKPHAYSHFSRTESPWQEHK